MFDGATKLFVDGGPIMVPLLLCSLVALTVVIERSIFHFRARRQVDAPGLHQVLDLVRAGKREAAQQEAEGSKNELVRAVGQSLADTGSENGGGRILEIFFAEENRRMSRYMMVLDTVITLAPLLGILGTVMGIIESFDLLGAGGQRDPMAVTGGIAKALITTAAGLSIAIVTLIPYNFFRSRIEIRLNAIEEVATFLETYAARPKNNLREG